MKLPSPMRNVYFAALLTITFCNKVSAQFNETIRTDRPGQAIGPFTTGHGILQVQSGFDHFGSRNDGDGAKQYGFLNNTVLRYGLTEPFEVSVLLEYKMEKVNQRGDETTLQGLNAFDVGMRYNIYTGKGLVPSIGFQIRARLPMLSADYEIKDLAPRFIIVTSQQLTEVFTLITNWGASWNGNNSTPRGTYVVNLSFPFNAKFGAFAETYGSVGGDMFVINFDTGFAFLATPDLQFDCYGGYGENGGVKDYFVSLGVSWRTKRNNI
jgi:hypothetical protein